MAAEALPGQTTLDELGVPLYAATFVVVDLETTGGSPAQSRITEIGAVKVRTGEVVGELQTLVDPGVPIPAAISSLTGITGRMVSGRPPVDAVLPAFLEFCRGAILVAHNARFDVGFLNANLQRLGYPRLDNAVVCTASLARRLVRDEVRDCRLATLAQHFRCATEPVHRALADARATVEVFHALLERAGSFGVTTLEDLLAFSKVRNTPLYRHRRSLSDGLPRAPGVYAFRSASGEVLYVGKATDLRDRVRAYFGSDDRRKIVDLLKESEAVDHWVCPTPIEAAVREVRLIQHHRPRFNRRSKTPERAVWLKLTADRYPRLSVVRSRKDDDPARYLGPLGRRTAELVAEAIQDVTPVRRCTDRIGPRTTVPPCALAEMGRCPAPCDGRIDPDAYAALIEPVHAAVGGDAATVLARAAQRMAAFAAASRFEEAARARDRMQALANAVAAQRLLAWTTSAAVLVASRPAPRSRTERDVVLVHHGRLVASARCAPDGLAVAVQALLAAHPIALPAAGATAPTAAEAAEIALVGGWLDGRGARVEHAVAPPAEAVAGGAALAALRRRLAAAGRATGRPETELAAKRTRRDPAPTAGH